MEHVNQDSHKSLSFDATLTISSTAAPPPEISVDANAILNGYKTVTRPDDTVYIVTKSCLSPVNAYRMLSGHLQLGTYAAVTLCRRVHLASSHL